MLAITAAQFSPVLQAGTRVLGRSFWGPPEPGRARASPFQRRLVADLQIGARVLGENTSFIPTSFQFYAGRAGTGAPFHFHGDAINLAAYGRCGRPVSAMPESRRVASRRAALLEATQAAWVAPAQCCTLPLAHSHLRTPTCALPLAQSPLGHSHLRSGSISVPRTLSHRARAALRYHTCRASCRASHDRKRWFLLPPSDAIYTRKPPLEWFHSDYPRAQKEMPRMLQCVQDASDVLYVNQPPIPLLRPRPPSPLAVRCGVLARAAPRSGARRHRSKHPACSFALGRCRRDGRTQC